MEFLSDVTQIIKIGADAAIIAIAFAIYKVERRLYTLEMQFNYLKDKLV